MDELEALGPFFTLCTGVSGEGWRPVMELVERYDVLRDRVEQVRARLAGADGRDVPVRVAASVAQMGVVARLVAPVVGVAVLTGDVLDLADARWKAEFGAFPVSVTGRTVADLGDVLGGGPVRGLVEATRRLSVSPQVLWGNVASAVNGAAVMLGRARPDLAGPAGDLVTGLLERPPLRGTGAGAGTGFRRRSCCLIYQAIPQGYCGDCILAT